MNRLNIEKLALTPSLLPLARSALAAFNSLRHLTLHSDVPLNLLTNDFLVALKHIGVVDFEFRSQLFWVRVGDGDWDTTDSRRFLVNNYDGDYPDLDVGLTAFLFRGREAEHEAVALNFPAARVPRDFCQRLLQVSSIIRPYRVPQA